MTIHPLSGQQSAPSQPSRPASRPGASPKAISQHYDLTDEFFKLWLGPEMIYSCAMFDGARDLASAQIRKLDHHIEAARAAGAERVLDVGCGWGGLLRRLVAHAGVQRAVGLTLSPSQANWIQRSAHPGIEVREEHWGDHKPSKPYDAVISIGAFEHFAHPGLDGVQKLAAYREFFTWCEGALAPRGRLSLQTIAFTAPLSQIDRDRAAFVADKIFPESELPLIWEPIAAAESRFELVSLRNDRDHYFQTLRHWERNLAARKDEAIALVSEAKNAEFRRYLRETAAAFKLGQVCLLRMSFVKTT